MLARVKPEGLTEREALMTRARARRAKLVREAEFELFKFIKLHQPHYRKPTHMSQLVEAFDRAMRGPVFCIVEAPSRHGKTSILLAGAARYLRYRERGSVAYCTYANDIAFRRSREVRELAARAGVWVGVEQRTLQEFEPSKSVAFWQTKSGGQFVAGGRNGQWIGEGFGLIIYDDPIKNPGEAQSQAALDEAWTTLKGTLMNRLEPGGSVFVSHQRWNDSDVIGRMKEWIATDPDAPKFDIVTLRAIEDIELKTDALGNERIVGGKPLCPWRYDLKALVQMASITGDWFWPNFMQDTTPRGKRVFPELGRYERPETDGAILLLSCDPGIEGQEKAEAKKLKPDPYGLVAAYARLVVDPDGVPCVGLDIVHAESEWLESIDLLNHLERLQLDDHPGAPVLLEEVSAFRILEQVARRMNPNLYLVAVTPRGSKLERAKPCAKSARNGFIRVPMQGGPWIAPFCKEVRNFTGKPGRRDNQVDALTQLYDYAELLLGVQSAGVRVAGQTTMAASPY